MQTLPFHPHGSGRTAHGGVTIVEDEVLILDPTSEEILASAPLPAGVESLETIYEKDLLFSLFPGATWYVGQPWQGTVILTLLEASHDRAAEGFVTFSHPDRPDQSKSWEAQAVPKHDGLTWDIDISLPRSHTYYSDIVFRVRLAGLVFDTLGGVVPAEGQPGASYEAEISNLFTGPEAFSPTRFVTYKISRRPHGFLLRSYKWAWS